MFALIVLIAISRHATHEPPLSRPAGGVGFMPYPVFTFVLIIPALISLSCGGGSTGTDPETIPNDEIILPVPVSGSRPDIPFVSIPGGSFRMGSDWEYDDSNPDKGKGLFTDETPFRTVTISTFLMSSCEITQGWFRKVTGSSPFHFAGDDNLPAEKVSWRDAASFCNALSDLDGLDRCYDIHTAACDMAKNGYRLPTEAEWEYACRAGTVSVFSAGDSIDVDGIQSPSLDIAGWYYANSGVKTHPVGKKEPNAFGLFDMHGNVWEWTNDRYGPYDPSGITNPIATLGGAGYVIRGGSWSCFPYNCRSARRTWYDPEGRYYGIGFRIVRRASR